MGPSSRATRIGIVHLSAKMCLTSPMSRRNDRSSVFIVGSPSPCFRSPVLCLLLSAPTGHTITLAGPRRSRGRMNNVPPKGAARWTSARRVIGGSCRDVRGRQELGRPQPAWGDRGINVGITVGFNAGCTSGVRPPAGHARRSSAYWGIRWCPRLAWPPGLITRRRPGSRCVPFCSASPAFSRSLPFHSAPACLNYPFTSGPRVPCCVPPRIADPGCRCSTTFQRSMRRRSR